MSLNIPAYVAQAFTIAKGMGLAVDVTFTRVTQSHSPSTGVMTTTGSTTILGVAVREDDNPKEYEAYGLTEKEPITLSFQPTTPGEKPALGMTVSWESRTRTVAKVLPTAPGGSTLVSRVICIS